MNSTRSRSASVDDEALRLPRPPGVLRRFWSSHPVFADVLIALLCLLLSLVPGGSFDRTLSATHAVIMSALTPVVVVIACVLLLWRRRRPLLPFIAAFAVEIVFLSALQPIGSPLILVACYSLAVYRTSRAAWIGFAVAVSTVAAIAGAGAVTGFIPVQVALNAMAVSVVMGLIGTLIGVNVGGRKRYLAALIDRSRQLLIERDQQAQLAAASERASIAREMHDIVSHSLTVIVALTEGAAATPDRDQARSAASSAAQTARSALTEMRAMLGVLRDDETLLPLAPLQPIPPQETVAAAQRAGFPVTLTVSGTARLSPTISHAVSRIVQEGVTNAMRHAPTASGIAVRLHYDEEHVRVDIVNDAANRRIGEAGFGLRGLIERATHAGGTLTSAPEAPERWRLHAELPTTPVGDELARTMEES